MYLKKIRLQNRTCFEDVTPEFPHTDGDDGGWNVIDEPPAVRLAQHAVR